MILRTKSFTVSEISDRLTAAWKNPVEKLPENYCSLSSTHNQAPVPAAVLIPFLKIEGAWHLLFTRRNENLTKHRGQVAFPGGRTDPEDREPETTALREANEEIGLNPADVRILGKLNGFLTITNYIITPIVGVIPWPYPIQMSVEEVSKVFTIPLEWLANQENYQRRRRILPEPYGQMPVIYYQPYDKEVLWGVSARLTLSLIQVLGM
jgi:8-oxo-dGTP pyrophosphatase MutT (NUDIX family)